MAVRAVRGAVQLERDEAGHMDEQVGALLTAILERNQIVADDLISVWFTATPDLHLTPTTVAGDTTRATVAATHSYGQPGVYDATITVTNQAGQTDRERVSTTVLAATPTP